MALLSTLKRLARLGGWIGLSAGAMVVASCGALLGGCNSTALNASDARPDGKRDALVNQPGPDTGVKADAGVQADTGEPADANQTDLWTVICE